MSVLLFCLFICSYTRYTSKLQTEKKKKKKKIQGEKRTVTFEYYIYVQTDLFT